MTGLSGAGKSTLASKLTQALALRGVHVECLDGDEVRKNLSHGLGFSREDRDRNVRRIGYVARMVARSGSCAITAAISPYRALREEIRSKTENFFEVYCECPIEVLTERDPKGLYKRALAGELKNFTGVGDPYEAPEDPQVLLRTDLMTPDECIQAILSALEEKGLLRLGGQGAALPPPFGGEVFEARTATLREFAAAEVEVPVSDVLLAQIQAVACGLLCPVTGFMTQREAVKVRKSSALESGTPWWDKPFVLPLSEGVTPKEGQIARLVHRGSPVGLVRVEQIWTDEAGVRHLAGPLEAMALGLGASAAVSARAVRRVARKAGAAHLVCLFTKRGPDPSSRLRFDTAVGVTDFVVLVTVKEYEEAWKELIGETSRVVTVPEEFPMTNERARLVVQKSVGGSASQFMDQPD